MARRLPPLSSLRPFEAAARLESFTRDRFEELMKIDPVVWRKEVKDHTELYETLKARMPKELYDQRDQLERSL